MWWRELQTQKDLWSPLPGPDESLIVDPAAIICDGVVLDALPRPDHHRRTHEDLSRRSPPGPARDRQ